MPIETLAAIPAQMTPARARIYIFRLKEKKALRRAATSGDWDWMETED
jgi:hypothetical protein